MKKKKIIITMAAAAMLVLWGCGSRKATVESSASRYERKPIKEVTQGELEADGMVIDAVALAESGRANEALVAYSRAAEKYPECGAAWYGMSQLLVERGWADSAEACARRAVALNKENVWYALALAQAQRMKGDTKGLTETWENIVAQHPDELTYHYELSNAYIEANNYVKAIEVLDRVEKKIGITEPISTQKAKLWAAAGKDGKAVAEMERLANSNPNEKRFSAIVATMHMETGNYSKAKKYYDRVLEADPEDPYIHIQLAEFYKKTGKAAEADNELLKAFDSPELDGKSKLQLLGSFYTDEEFFGSHRATAFRLMDKAMANCTDSTEYAAFYGQVLLQQERYAEASHQLETALRKDSSHYELWEMLLVSLHSTPGAEARMEAYALRAAKLFPLHTLPHYLLALANYERKDYAQALSHLSDITKWGFTKGYLERETYSLTAECLYRAGQYTECWAAFERLLAKYPDDMSTLNNYAYYLSEQVTDLEKAERMSRRTVEAEPQNANNLDTYGWILHLMGRDKEARTYLEKAAKIDKTNKTIQDHLGKLKGQ